MKHIHFSWSHNWATGMDKDYWCFVPWPSIITSYQRRKELYFSVSWLFWSASVQYNW